MDWVCPKCTAKMADLKCGQCGYRGSLEDGIFGFNYGLNKFCLAEEKLKSEKTDVNNVIKDKSGARKFFNEVIKDRIDVKGRVLDIGSGFCLMGCDLSKSDFVKELWCCDVAKSGLKIGKEIASRENCKIKGFVAANAEHLPFPDNYFDCTVSMSLLHHVANPKKALKEIKRVLKPNAVYYAFGEVFAQGLLKPFYGRHLHEKSEKYGIREELYSLSNWKEFLREFDYEIEFVRPFSRFIFFWKIAKMANLLEFFGSGLLIKAKKGFSTSAQPSANSYMENN